MTDYLTPDARTENLILPAQTVSLISDIARWARFLSIVGFVIIGILIVGLISSGIMITRMNHYAGMTQMYPYTPGIFSWPFAIAYLLMLGIYFIPFFFLFQFSVRMKKGLASDNTKMITDGFNSLKNHYVTIGIFIIIGLVFFLLSVIYMITFFSSMGM